MRFSVIVACFLSICFISGCDDSATTGPDGSDISGGMASHSECKSSAADYSDSQECVEFQFFADGTLEIRHINTGLNCCPVSFDAEISVNENVIVIDESNSGGMCDCLCLFDIDYRLENVPMGTYELKMIGGVGRDPLMITLNLRSTPSGQSCVDRNEYPWGS